MEKLIGLIRGKNINPIEVDELVWNATKDGSYTVKSNMYILEGDTGVVSFPTGLVWN